jgi:fatty-acid desaturase
MMFPEVIVVCPEIMQNTLSTLHGKNVQFLGALPLVVAKVSLTLSCLFVSPPVRLSVSLSFHRTNFHEIFLLETLLQFIDTTQIWLKSEKNLKIPHEDMRFM